MLADFLITGLFGSQLLQDHGKQRKYRAAVRGYGKNLKGPQNGIFSETELQIVNAQDNIPHILGGGGAFRVPKAGIYHHQLILMERNGLLLCAEGAFAAGHIEDFRAVVSVKDSFPVISVRCGGNIPEPVFLMIQGKIGK